MSESSPTTVTETPPSTVTATPKNILWAVVIGIGVQGCIGFIAIVIIAIFKIDAPAVVMVPLLTITGQLLGTLQGMLINTRQPVEQNGETAAAPARPRPPTAATNASKVTPKRK